MRPAFARSPLTLLALLTAACMPQVVAGEATSESVWAQPSPPFSAVAKEFAAPPSGGQFALSLGVPWYAPAERISADQLRGLEAAASLAASRMRGLKLRAPKMKVVDGRYRMLLARDLGDAAASYGPGLEDVSLAQRTEIFRAADINSWPGWDYFLRLSELEGMGENRDWSIYREKIAVSLAHEIFHGVQASYPPLSVRADRFARERDWVLEALPDAIAPWSIRGLRFLGNPVFQFPTRLRSGNERYGKVLGLRPYDYPLDLELLPDYLKIKPGLSRDQRRQLAGYMTNAFWRWLFEDKASAGSEWRALPALMGQRRSGRNPREELLNWTDAAVRAALPTFSGLHRALPAFIAERVEYPDQVVGSRKGVFEHPFWLEYMFQDGCPLITLDEQQSTQRVDLTILPLAAKCLRVYWTGARLPDSGAPVAVITATPLQAQDVALAMDSLHLGHHGSAEGLLASYTDKATGSRVRAFHPLDLDPLLAAPTRGELVLNFTNVARDPLRSVRQRYRIEIVVASSQVQGSVTQPADPEAEPPRPASTGKARGKRRSGGAVGGALQHSDDGSVSIGSADTGFAADELQDCLNGSLKQASSATLGLIQKRRDKPVSGTPPPSCAVFQKMLSPAFAAQHRGVLDAQLNLPRIATGTTGAVRGAQLQVSWHDPALPEPHDRTVSASTELVNVTLTEATVSYVRGAYAARFVADQHGIDGTVSGDFVFPRADTGRLEAGSEEPLDYLSSDALLAFHYAGLSGESLQRQAREARERAQPEGDPAPGPDARVLGPPACAETGIAQTGDCRGGAGTDEAARVECFLDLMAGALPDPQRSALREQLATQLRELDAASRAQVIGPALDAMHEEGRTCNAP